jgi:hypothetical protein
MGSDVPAGVVTLTDRTPVAIPCAAVSTIGSAVLPGPAMDAVTPVPLTVTAVAPAKFQPRIVAPTLVPGSTDPG